MTAWRRTLIVVLLIFIGACSTETSREERVQTETRSKDGPQALDPQILVNRSFGESPKLAALVAEGKLPPVAERLPENPKVKIPYEAIGRYGGEIRRAMTGDIIQMPAVMKIKNEGLLEYAKPKADSLEANLTESYEYQDGGKVAIVRLRRGIKWPDGHPFA